MSTKIARTNVTAADLELARGGHLPVGRVPCSGGCAVVCASVAP